MFSWIKKIFRKKETAQETKERLEKLCKEGYGGMDAQVAMNELCRYLLGEDWYIADPVNNIQANLIIVYEIERKYKDKNRKKVIK